MKSNLYFLLLVLTILSSYKDPDLKVKTYFCIYAEKITYFDTKPPTHRWGECYQTNQFSRGNHAKIKQKLTIDTRIYRNFIVQLNSSNFYPYIHIE